MIVILISSNKEVLLVGGCFTNFEKNQQWLTVNKLGLMVILLALNKSRLLNNLNKPVLMEVKIALALIELRWFFANHKQAKIKGYFAMIAIMTIIIIIIIVIIIITVAVDNTNNFIIIIIVSGNNNLF